MLSSSCTVSSFKICWFCLHRLPSFILLVPAIRLVSSCASHRPQLILLRLNPLWFKAFASLGYKSSAVTVVAPILHHEQIFSQTCPALPISNLPNYPLWKFEIKHYLLAKNLGQALSNIPAPENPIKQEFCLAKKTRTAGILGVRV